jgi:hypothetical protein
LHLWWTTIVGGQPIMNPTAKKSVSWSLDFIILKH